MTSYPLSESVTATIVGGTATASIGPKRFGDVWHVTLMNSTTNATADSQLRVYRNLESRGAQVDSTYSGNSATSPCDLTLRAGEKLVWVWTLGSAGATCTGTVEGELISGRR